MTYNKLKKELRLFFSWKQIKLEIKAFLEQPIKVLKKCDVSETIINEFNEKMNFNQKLTDKLMIKFLIVIVFISILMFINDYILV